MVFNVSPHEYERSKTAEIVKIKKNHETYVNSKLCERRATHFWAYLKKAQFIFAALLWLTLIFVAAKEDSSVVVGMIFGGPIIGMVYGIPLAALFSFVGYPVFRAVRNAQNKRIYDEIFAQDVAVVDKVGKLKREILDYKSQYASEVQNVGEKYKNFDVTEDCAEILAGRWRREIEAMHRESNVKALEASCCFCIKEDGIYYARETYAKDLRADSICFYDFDRNRLEKLTDKSKAVALAAAIAEKVKEWMETGDEGGKDQGGKQALADEDAQGNSACDRNVTVSVDYDTIMQSDGNGIFGKVVYRADNANFREVRKW